MFDAVLASVLAFATGCGYTDTVPPPRTPGGVPGPGGPALHDEALRQLAAVKSTEFIVRGEQTRVDEARGIFEYNESGFVDYAVNNVAPDAIAQLMRVLSHRRTRPTAETYAFLLRQIPLGGSVGRWFHVPDVASLQPGDVIACRPAETDDTRGKDQLFGRMAIVDGPPRERAPGEWRVPVIDSSAGHGGDDPRRPNGPNGLGRGAMVLVVEDGLIKGYRWSTNARSPLVVTSVMLGRLN